MGICGSSNVYEKAMVPGVKESSNEGTTKMLMRSHQKMLKMGRAGE